MVDLKQEKDPPQKCSFCYLDKKEVTLVYEENGKEEVLTKEEAKKRYQIFLKNLSKTKNIQEILDRAKEPRILK